MSSMLFQLLFNYASGNPYAWDISHAVWDPVGNLGNFNLSSYETGPNGIHFKPDGTKMYIVGQTGDDVNEFNLSTAWDVTTATYVTAFAVSTQDTVPQGVFFHPDGTNFYVVGSGNDNVYEYSMSTPWSVATASYVKSFSVATQETTPTDLFFNSTGTKMYVMGSAGDDVNEYNLATAWDIATAVYSKVFSVATQETVPTGLCFSTDGSKMYVLGETGEDVNQYNLSTPWDVGSASYVQVKSINYSNRYTETTPRGLAFSQDGTKMYVIGTVTVAVQMFVLSTPWDVSTLMLSTPTNYLYLGDQETAPTDIYFNPDGSKLYTIGSGYDSVYQYTLSSPWELSSATYLQSFSVAAQESTPNGIYFSNDGVYMYVTGEIGDDVNQYTLSTPWNISTASYTRTYNYNAPSRFSETAPQAVTFNDTGTAMFIVGTSLDTVQTFTLTTPWDISTASIKKPSNYLDLLSQGPSVAAITFSNDGTKMYTVDSGTDYIYQYDLSVAWSVETASYVTSLIISGYELSATGIWIDSTGTRLYIIGESSDNIRRFALSTAYDLSTATYVNGLVVSGFDSVPQGVFFKPDGLSVFFLGDTNNSIYKANLSVAWDITTAIGAGSFVMTDVSVPYDLYFKSDGTAFYVTESGSTIDRYNLTTPWDITTASLASTLSITSVMGNAQGIYFSTDGLKMYLSSTNEDAVYQWTLTTAWDITTATWAHTGNFGDFAIASYQPSVGGLCFKPDGTKMYITGTTDEVNEFNLSTAWDVTTASFVQSYSVATQTLNPEGIFFKSDGTKMYVISASTDAIFEYDIT